MKNYIEDIKKSGINKLKQFSEILENEEEYIISKLDLGKGIQQIIERKFIFVICVIVN